MSEGTIITLFVATGLLIGWFMHGRTSRAFTSIMRRLAAEKNGVLESGTFLRLPKLLLSHNGKEMEISAASTGGEGSSPYTYMLFQDVESAGLEFRILPKSVQTVIDSALGLRKATLTSHPPLDKSLVIYTNDDDALGTLLSERVQQALLGWVTKDRNRIQDIRNHDHKLMFCVDGILSDTADFRQLIEGACLLYDELARVTEGRSLP
ncbi:MAG: hypothetical protein E2P05_02695 [Acidobacteria bacterium]|nr:MAG: hypothetical protein E2P05_02695 [Acidobacteriota bacterium]